MSKLPITRRKILQASAGVGVASVGVSTTGMAQAATVEQFSPADLSVGNPGVGTSETLHIARPVAPLHVQTEDSDVIDIIVDVSEVADTAVDGLNPDDQAQAFLMTRGIDGTEIEHEEYNPEENRVELRVETNADSQATLDRVQLQTLRTEDGTPQEGLDITVEIDGDGDGNSDHFTASATSTEEIALTEGAVIAGVDATDVVAAVDQSQTISHEIEQVRATDREVGDATYGPAGGMVIQFRGFETGEHIEFDLSDADVDVTVGETAIETNIVGVDEGDTDGQSNSRVGLEFESPLDTTDLEEGDTIEIKFDGGLDFSSADPTQEHFAWTGYFDVDDSIIDPVKADQNVPLQYRDGYAEATIGYEVEPESGQASIQFESFSVDDVTTEESVPVEVTVEETASVVAEEVTVTLAVESPSEEIVYEETINLEEVDDQMMVTFGENDDTDKLGSFDEDGEYTAVVEADASNADTVETTDSFTVETNDPDDEPTLDDYTDEDGNADTDDLRDGINDWRDDDDVDTDLLREIIDAWRSS